MIDCESVIKAGRTRECACGRCDTSASLQRRVCRCILTSGRRAPSSHPARCSLCRRGISQTVALKIARFLLFPDPLTRQERAARPPPSLRLPDKHYLELPTAAALTASSTAAWKSVEPLPGAATSELIRSFPWSDLNVLRDPAVVTSAAASSQPPTRVERGTVCICAWTRNYPLRVRSQDAGRN